MRSAYEWVRPLCSSWITPRLTFLSFSFSFLPFFLFSFLLSTPFFLLTP
uniref:Uncharacterized protein n=1 Tax=Aspergillus niger TaxID=5061 RepID=O60031_ASPNG|nr:hypothetical protein [Aspergillus niger]